MKLRKSKDVIYPCRIPREVFAIAKDIAASLDLSTCQLIRAALREKITAEKRMNKQPRTGGRLEPREEQAR
jgi:hypothetical protein